MAKKEKKVKVIPLGGLDGIGRNMTLVEWDKKILIIDMGLKFPEESTPGIDCIIPDISYLKDKKDQIVGTIFTHGHYDHIGAVPYLVNELGTHFPMYAGAMAKEIIMKRQREFPYSKKPRVNVIKGGDKEKMGPFEVEFVKMNHNIPDTFGFFIKTPGGNIFHSADFKFDEDPIFDKPTDFEKLKEIGKEGVDLLMSDSTGAEEEGESLSEKTIMENLDKLFQEAEGRIIASTFSSLLIRIQELIKLSENHGRKVVIDGRSMKENVKAAQKLGYIKMEKDTRIKAKHISNYPDKKITIICTGAQGERRASMMRIANKEHRQIRLKEKDMVIFSSSTVPGNERSVQNLKDQILKQGSDVYHSEMMDIHASGHAKQEEIKKLIEMIKPKFLMPIHGQYSMLKKHAKLGEKMGIPKENIIVGEDGNILKIGKEKLEIGKKKVSTNYILVDGLGVGDVGKVVLRDRKALAEDGIFVIIAVVDRETGKIQNSPDIISRGFVYLNESRNLLSEARNKVESIVKESTKGKKVNYDYLKKEIREKIADFLYTKTHRRPMVLPVVIGV